MESSASSSSSPSRTPSSTSPSASAAVPATATPADALPAPPPVRVLVVAHKTAATQPLLDAVHERAGRGPCVFTLLVPNATHGLHKVVDPEDQAAGEAQTVLDRALPLLEQAAGSHVRGLVGDPDPIAAVHDAINLHGFDEVIVSTLSARVSRWLRLDLPSKVAGMGLPVTTVTPGESVGVAGEVTAGSGAPTRAG